MGARGGALPMSWAVLMAFEGGRAALVSDYLCPQVEGRYYARGWYLLDRLDDEDDGEGWRRHVRAVLGPGIDRFLEKAGGAAALGLGGEAAQQLAAILAHLG